MSRAPHPSALFTLVPTNDAARRVVEHPQNLWLVSEIDGRVGLDIGPHITSRSRDTLATIGRSNCDVIIEEPCISKLQCEFQVLSTGVVLLRDHSSRHSTQVMGENPTPYKSGVRQVVINARRNTEVGMGFSHVFGQSSLHLILFELVWHVTEQDDRPIAEEVLAKVKEYNGNNFAQEANPALARTIDLAPTTFPSARVTRIHTPGSQQIELRYDEERRIGQGTFGTVFRAVDMDSGRLIALKKIHIAKNPEEDNERWRQRWFENRIIIKREVEALSSLLHNHVVEYIWHEECDREAKVNIFFELMDGNLDTLTRSGHVSEKVALVVFRHLLRALDFLDSKSLVHRDVKPGNILYRLLPDETILFKLADFGLCNHVADSKTLCGTQRFMAPEVYNSGQQTAKADVWSLFATILYLMDGEQFRSKAPINQAAVFDSITKAANSNLFINLRDMAAWKPDDRISAGQMLLNIFGEVGCCSRRSLLSPYNPAEPAQTRQRNQAKLRGRKRRATDKISIQLQRTENAFEVAGREKMQDHMHRFQNIQRKRI